MIDPNQRWQEQGGSRDYAGLLTFGSLPWTEDPAELTDVDVAVVGAPDGRPHIQPPGGSLRASCDSRRWLPLGGRTSKRRSMRSRVLRMVVYGDAPVVPSDPVASHAAIERAGWRGRCRRRDPDRARRGPLDCRARHSRLCGPTMDRSGSIHFDTHTDTGREVSASRSLTALRCLASSRPARSSRSRYVQIGSAGLLAWRESSLAGGARDHELLHARRARLGIEEVVGRSLGIVGDGPVFAR